MRYRVLKDFSDLKDHNYKYTTGDTFPRSGYIVSPKRIEELSSANNRRGCAVIEAIQEEEEAKPNPIFLPEGNKKKRKKDAIRNLS